MLFSGQFYAAPMVGASHLAFRMHVRAHGADVASTPMIDADGYVASESYRAQWTWHEDDRPLIVQFASRRAGALVQAMDLLAPHADAIELNVGCPTRCARKSGYGAYLMNDIELLKELVGAMADAGRRLGVPVLVKTRVFDDYDRTLAYATALVDAGASMLTIHARTREEKRSGESLARWYFIARLVRDLPATPIVANGNVRHRSDAVRCLKETGAAGVMSATALLHAPRLFDDDAAAAHPVNVAAEYLTFVRRYGASQRDVQRHLHAILHGRWLRENAALRATLARLARRDAADATLLVRLSAQLEQCERHEDEPLRSALEEKHGTGRTTTTTTCPYFLEARCRNSEPCPLGKHAL